jgi:hypothetical protein
MLFNSISRIENGTLWAGYMVFDWIFIDAEINAQRELPITLSSTRERSQKPLNLPLQIVSVTRAGDCQLNTDH